MRPRSYEFEELMRALKVGKVDLVFTHDIDASVRDVCSSMKLYAEQLYVTVMQDHPLAARESLSVEGLRDLPLLLPDPEEMPTLAGYFASIIPQYASLEKHGTYCDVDTLILNIRTGNGVGLSCGKHLAFEHSIAHLPITGIDASFYESVMWLKENDSEHIRQFIEALVDKREDWFVVENR